jgi:hypothetical protein
MHLQGLLSELAAPKRDGESDATEGACGKLP